MSIEGILNKVFEGLDPEPPDKPKLREKKTKKNQKENEKENVPEIEVFENEKPKTVEKQNVRDDDEVQTILRKLEDKYADADNNELLMAVSKTKTSFDFKFRDHVKDEVERCLSFLENGNVDINRYLKMQ